MNHFPLSDSFWGLFVYFFPSSLNHSVGLSNHYLCLSGSGLDLCLNQEIKLLERMAAIKKKKKRQSLFPVRILEQYSVEAGKGVR